MDLTTGRLKTFPLTVELVPVETSDRVADDGAGDGGIMAVFGLCELFCWLWSVSEAWNGSCDAWRGPALRSRYSGVRSENCPSDAAPLPLVVDASPWAESFAVASWARREWFPHRPSSVDHVMVYASETPP